MDIVIPELTQNEHVAQKRQHAGDNKRNLRDPAAANETVQNNGDKGENIANHCAHEHGQAQALDRAALVVLEHLARAAQGIQRNGDVREHIAGDFGRLAGFL